MKSQAGGALVEFAIAIPLLMMLLVGLIEIGRVTYFGIEVANAARAGAQYGSLSYPNTTGTNMQVAATNDGRNGISNLDTTGQYVCACWNPATGIETPTAPSAAACSVPCSTGGHSVTYAQVTVSGTIRPLFDYQALGLPDQWVITRVATIRVAQPQ